MTLHEILPAPVALVNSWWYNDGNDFVIRTVLPKWGSRGSFSRVDFES